MLDHVAKLSQRGQAQQTASQLGVSGTGHAGNVEDLHPSPTLQLIGKDQLQHDADDEDRRREGDEGQHRTELVKEGVLLDRLIDTERNPNDQSEGQGSQTQPECVARQPRISLSHTGPSPRNDSPQLSANTRRLLMIQNAIAPTTIIENAR